MHGKDYIQSYHKRDYFIFLIVNFPFINRNIPAATAYDVLRYSRACVQQSDFLVRTVVTKVTQKGHVALRLKSL
jgi:hypothetical protein